MRSGPDGKRYSIDSSALIDGWARIYPPDVFPGVWEKLGFLADSEVLIASEEVLIELKLKEDNLHKWAQEQTKMFVPHDAEVQNAVRVILNDHGRLLNLRKNRSGADPFVIAVAMKSKCAVVTQEKRSPNPKETPHIPDVCDAHRIRCISLIELLREQGFTFQGG